MIHLVQRPAHGLMSTLIALMFTLGAGVSCPLLYAEVSPDAPTRWLWVPGPQDGEGCEGEVRSAHKSFVKRMKELLAVEMLLDGQGIPCQDERCLSARMEAAGAKVGLLAKATCTARALSLDLTVLPLDRPALKYREGMSLTQASSPPKGARFGPRGGAPISAHLTPAQRVGVKLANAVTLGPPPAPTPEPPSRLRLGVLLSMQHEVMSIPEAIGGGVHLELSYLSSTQRGLWYGSVGTSAIQSPYYAQRALMAAVGGRYRLSQGRLSPTLGGGLLLSSERARQRVDKVILFGETAIAREETYIEREEHFRLRPALDAGLNWRGRSLELSLVARLSPLTLSPLELGQGAWSTVLGVRW